MSRQYRESARLAAQQEAEEDALERERQKADLIRDLASSQGSAEKILARNKAAALKRSSARRRTEEERFVAASMPRFGAVEVEDEGPFDPLDGAGEESSLYVVRSEYDDPYALFGGGLANGRWLNKLRGDTVAFAGGFSLHDVYKRGLFEAYAGLGCILSEELGQVEVA
jgi:CDK-activating kinase assembly factor MAT1